MNADTTLSESYSHVSRAQSDVSAQEVGVKSILNLTREPLRSRKKDISFHEEVLSIARDDASMEVKERILVPKIVSSIYERSVPSLSFSSDHGNASAAKPATKSTFTDVHDRRPSNTEMPMSPSASLFERFIHRCVFKIFHCYICSLKQQQMSIFIFKKTTFIVVIPIFP